MTGYIESLTDPSYKGQFLVQSFPLVGNYGIIPPDFESLKPHIQGYIVREACDAPANFRCESTLHEFLLAHGVPGLMGVDTRALTKLIRETGVMNAILTDKDPTNRLEELLPAVRAHRIEQPVKLVTLSDMRAYNPDSKTGKTIALLDFGAKENMIRELVKRDCTVLRFPAFFDADSILSHRPDGILLSNGPGDPADNPAIIEQVRILMDSGVPIFGICLGHQLMALAAGCRTEKLKYGHRGANQPVRENATGRVYITSQNHGYAVTLDSIPASGANLAFVNVNDDTCEGLTFPGKPAFSVQFHPEAAAGPLDTGFLFDRFLSIVHSS
jgi:carbamoyl-phosphate synthase small subunit